MNDALLHYNLNSNHLTRKSNIKKDEKLSHNMQLMTWRQVDINTNTLVPLG